MSAPGLTVGSLFSGIGGLDLAVEEFFEAGTVWHCEFDKEPSKVLAARWPGVPNLGDVTRVDWSAVERVDIMCGGFPCPDLSLAGRRAGMRPGTRSGLWSDFVKAIAALMPRVVVVENVRGLLSGCAESNSDVEPCQGCLGISNIHRPVLRALGRVLGDLAALGFDAEWGALQASEVGAPHARFRVFVVAYARGIRLDSWGVAGSGETAGGRASAVDRGRGGASVALLPTPSASNPNDEEDLDGWQARRARVKETAQNGNGFGMPLGVAVRLLPTPTTQPDTGNGHARNLGKEIRLLPTPVTTDSKGARNSTAHRTTRGAHSGSTITDVLLPTARASRGASSTETMYALGAERDNVGDQQGNVTGKVAWGIYEPAIHRWEAVLGRPAPSPTRPDGKNGNHRLNPELSSWMMGYPAGWVTDILNRDPAIKASGNGVVPQQAFAALEVLWGRVLESAVAA